MAALWVAAFWVRGFWVRGFWVPGFRVPGSPCPAWSLVFVVAVATVVYEVTYLSVLPDLIGDPAELPRANRAVETSHAGAALLGPAAGGALVAALTPAAVILLDALSFAAGALLTAVNRWDRERPAGRSTPRDSGLLAGWRWLRGNPYVRPMTLYLAANNVGVQAFQTALLLYVARTLDLGAAAVGLAVAASGAGFLAGALVSPPLAHRLGTGRLMIAAALLGPAGIATVAAGTLPAVLAGAALAGAGPGLANLHSIAVRQTVTPARLLGRVTAVVKTVSYGSATAGALAGGVAATLAGPRAVIAAAAVVFAGAVLILAGSAVRTLRSATPPPAR